MNKLITIKTKENIIFGFLFFFFFIVIGLYPLIEGEPARLWAIILSIIILIVTIIQPRLFTFLNKFWIRFGASLQKITSPIVMFFIFFFVVTPIGVLLRLFKKDIMHLKKKSTTYWIDKPDDAQSMRKMF